MLKLYDHPFSPYAQKVKISLREKDVPFESLVPEGIGAGSTGGEFADASPRREVPVLIDGDTRVFDSTIILEYIEDRWPMPPMLPDTPAERARVRMLEDIMDTHYEPINWGIGELRSFKRATGALAEKIEAKAAEQLHGYYNWLEKQLGDREWFNGASFGWGDLSVIPYLNGSHNFGTGVPAGTKLAAWRDRVNRRPSVAATTKDITDMLEAGRKAGGPAQMADVAALVEQGLFKREYRDHRLEWMIKAGGLEVITKGLEKGNIRFGPDFN